MSKKCKAYSQSKLGLELPDSRKAFYAGWEAALAQPQMQPCAEHKPWVGLTEGEINNLGDGLADLLVAALARAIEAKLKEKNT